MVSTIKTNYGVIPISELVVEPFPSEPAVLLPNYIKNLFVKEIDDLSAPLVAIFPDKQIKIQTENFACFDDFAYSQIKSYKAQGAKQTILPKQLTPKLAYFIGYFLGDGSLSDVRNSFVSFGRFEHKIKVCDEFRLQVEIIQKLFEDLFGLVLPIREERIVKGERLYYVDITSKPIYRFLTRVFGFPSGSKTDFVEIPKVIVDSPIELKAWFVRGVFDAEGDTRTVEAGFKSHSRVKIRMKSKEFIREFKLLFENAFGVLANGPYVEENSAYFQIEKHSSIVSLSNQNIFFHPIKRWRLKKTAGFLTAKIAARGAIKKLSLS